MSTVTAARPGLTSWLTLFKCEAKMVARDTAGLVVPIGLPLLILVMSAASASSEEVVNGRSALDVYVMPLVFTIVLATIGIINMPSILAYYRRTGVLRRLAVTPASPTMVLVTQMLVSLVQAVIGMGLAYTIAVLAFGAQPPLNLGVALGIVSLAIAAMYAVGMIVAALAPTPNSAVAMGLVGFFALGALGGLFGGTENLPDQLTRIGELLPFGASVEALSNAWAGASVGAEHLISLGVTTVLGVVVASVFFRWD